MMADLCSIWVCPDFEHRAKLRRCDDDLWGGYLTTAILPMQIGGWGFTARAGTCVCSNRHVWPTGRMPCNSSNRQTITQNDTVLRTGPLFTILVDSCQPQIDSTKKPPSERNFKEKNLSTFPIRDLYPEQKKPPPAQLYRKPYRSHFDCSFHRFSEHFCDFFEFFLVLVQK